MAWEIKIIESARKEIAKLSKPDQEKILSYLRKKIRHYDEPKDFGKPLGNVKAGLRRYRVEKYRIICQIHNKEVTIIVLKVAKKDEVYD